MSSTKFDFSPGSKNWIAKFFDLLDKGIFDLDDELIHQKEENLTHFISHQTGLIYGTAKSFIFSNAQEKQKFNTDEQLQLLLFETLLFTYVRKQQDKVRSEAFIEALIDFYQGYTALGLKAKISRKLTNNPIRKIEILLASRVGVKSSFLGANYWLKHLSNAFIFLDVILFRAYLEGDKTPFSTNYERYASSVLNGLIYAALIDGKVEHKEQQILLHFKASAALPPRLDKMYRERIQIGIPLKVLQQERIDNPLLAQITYEFGYLLLSSTHLINREEKQKLQDLGKVLNISEAQMLISEEMSMAFIAQSGPDELLIYKQSTEAGFAYKETSKRWLRIIGRNRDRLVTEIRESKELMALLQKSTKEDLSPEEKEQVKKQFYDILKSMPSLALFLLPGGSLLLPIVMKLVPELIPSAFKINEVEKKTTEDEL
ncbi:MAG: LETM1 domain-containing protein [Flavobacteriales bacterium]